MRLQNSTLLLVLVPLLLTGGCEKDPAGPSEQAADSWITGTRMPSSRYGTIAAVANGILYVIGGSGESTSYPTLVEAYDPSTDSWTTKAPLPAPGEDQVIAGDNNHLYVIGGYHDHDAMADLQIYDLAADTWSAGSDIPTPQQAGTAGILNGILYVVGGVDYSISPPTIFDILEAYDIAADTWSTRTSIPSPREKAVCGVINGQLLVAGGSHSYERTGANEAYNPVSDSWTARSSMPLPGIQSWNSLVGGVIDGKLYLVSTEIILQGSTTTRALHVNVYDPATDSWSTKTPYEGSGSSSSGGVIDGKIYIVARYDELLIYKP